ncbi:global regulator [Candidatus Gastranaerophilus sp. (ex Termes propinquus)]|nr:global regulator [Candidatus Gastranaerophilus sp. (ex Termes propinquus)]
MLILTRKINQKLIINDNIEITILEVNGATVKVGIDAPSEVHIYREEIYKEIKNTNKQAQAPEVQDADAISKNVANKSFDLVSKLKKKV